MINPSGISKTRFMPPIINGFNDVSCNGFVSSDPIMTSSSDDRQAILFPDLVGIYVPFASPEADPPDPIGPPVRFSGMYVAFSKTQSPAGKGVPWLMLATIRL